MSKEIDLAWLGGFFDGDGCVCVYLIPNPKGIPYYKGQVAVSQKGRGLLEYCEHVATESGAPIPCLSDEGCGVYFRLQWTGHQDSRLLLLLRPYLHRPKLIQRAEIYCKIFDPEKAWAHRKSERDELYMQWCQLQGEESEVIYA